MIRTQIQLTEEQVGRVKEAAILRKVSMAEIIREAVDYWLVTAAPMSKEERFRKSMEAIGRFNSGLTDISVNHDYYLNEGGVTW